ncbi:MAG TPA: response regulator [Verrucomicrobiae bacterium]|nr:response regulator [Verrucomicrobiae bacterium]
MMSAVSPQSTGAGLNDQTPELAAADLNRRTILVADDRHDDFELLRLMFKKSGILNPLQWVESVRDAVRYLRGEGVYGDRDAYPFPTLLLLDLHLGDGSGFDVLRALHKQQLRAPLAVVVLTGSDVSAITQAYGLGAHSFLVKPLKFSEFENMVNHVRGIKLTVTRSGRLLEVES